MKLPRFSPEFRLGFLRFFLVTLAVGSTPIHAAEPKGRTTRIDVMTWYHPVLEPGLADITLLCTVVEVKRAPNKYESPYWSIRLRIDERLFVDPHFQKYLENVRFVVSGDFRHRRVGERLVFFGGLGEQYEGEDFLLPCWSGTRSDLGIVLHGPDDVESSLDDQLLDLLKALAKGDVLDAQGLELFAEYSPRGVAKSLIRDRMHEEFARDVLREAEEDEAAVARLTGD